MYKGVWRGLCYMVICFWRISYESKNTEPAAPLLVAFYSDALYMSRTSKTYNHITWPPSNALVQRVWSMLYVAQTCNIHLTYISPKRYIHVICMLYVFRTSNIPQSPCLSAFETHHVIRLYVFRKFIKISYRLKPTLLPTNCCFVTD